MTEEREEPRRLSKAAQETLAIIAYHQPVTRAEIEAVRGVQASRGTLDVLLELGLVKMRGRRRTPGRPVTFGTTDAFLEHYGLATLGDLPGIAEMRAAGLLALDLPPGFSVPDPMGLRPGEDEDPLEDGDEAPNSLRISWETWKGDRAFTHRRRRRLIVRRRFAPRLATAYIVRDIVTTRHSG
jgi:segregation and condensation protein B